MAIFIHAGKQQDAKSESELRFIALHGELDEKESPQLR